MEYKMEQNLVEKKQVQLPVAKKVYTPPTLIVYGKLTELTAGGSGTKNENFPVAIERKP
jgi:hypothetical protein